MAHSLGAYALLQVPVNSPLVLLDPSLALADIVLSNLEISKDEYKYNDGDHQILLSPSFISSLRILPSIEKVCASFSAQTLLIFGAKHGGYKVAEQYHSFIPQGTYTVADNSGHHFNDDRDLEDIIERVVSLDTIYISNPSR